MNKKYVKIAAIILPVFLAVICLIIVVRNDNQASMPVPMSISFSGEYSYDGENWYPYNENSNISALDGEVTVKGRFDTDIFEGAILNFYSNHIAVSMYVNGEQVYMDSPTEIKSYGIDLMPSMCGKRWEQILCSTITVEDEVEFHLSNYHKYGNKEAYKELLSTFIISPLDKTVLETYLKPYIYPFEIMGTVILIVGIMLFGTSVYAAVFKSKMANYLFKIGTMTLFIGGYIVLDVMMVFFADGLMVMRTYGGQLCRMLGVYFLGLNICAAVTKKHKKVAELVMGVSAIINILIIIVVISGKVLLYDTKIVWDYSQCIISLILIIMCFLELMKEKKRRTILSTYIFVNISILLDIMCVGYHMFCSDICSKVLFCIMLLVILFLGAKQVVMDNHASIKNKKLKEELENSHIALMLSQIQPHFIYNTLGTIGEFCEEEPKKASDLVQKFSLYLRGNFTELDNPMPIRLSKELEHVKHYADIEQIRFPDMKIEYDIQNDNFLIPALTIQPLVENAIKHGLMGLESGGTVKISCYETDKYYEVKVEDDGVGFDESVFEDGKKHIGI
ncbi:MAG: histidine kinase, partial [Lachnospiraceae bacterium]|nr:histidine kinase [Lachnospiraceae bacterium]